MPASPYSITHQLQIFRPQKILTRLPIYKNTIAGHLLLIHGKHLPVASVGYDDAYHFSKLFKKRYGISPSQARRN